MPRFHGRKGQIALAAAGSPDTAIGSLRSWNIQFAKDKVDVTSFLDNNKRKVVGLKDVTGTIDGFFDTDYIALLFTASDASVSSNLRITPNTDLPTYYFEGPAWVDLSNVSGAVDDAIKVQLTFDADGDWAAVFGGVSA